MIDWMNEEEEAPGTCFLWEENFIPGTFLCGLRGSFVSIAHVSTDMAISPADLRPRRAAIAPVCPPLSPLPPWLSSCPRLCTQCELHERSAGSEGRESRFLLWLR